MKNGASSGLDIVITINKWLVVKRVLLPSHFAADCSDNSGIPHLWHILWPLALMFSWVVMTIVQDLVLFICLCWGGLRHIWTLQCCENSYSTVQFCILPHIDCVASITAAITPLQHSTEVFSHLVIANLQFQLQWVNIPHLDSQQPIGEPHPRNMFPKPIPKACCAPSVTNRGVAGPKHSPPIP